MVSRRESAGSSHHASRSSDGGVPVRVAQQDETSSNEMGAGQHECKKCEECASEASQTSSGTDTGPENDPTSGSKSSSGEAVKQTEDATSSAPTTSTRPGSRTGRKSTKPGIFSGVIGNLLKSTPAARSISIKDLEEMENEIWKLQKALGEKHRDNQQCKKQNASLESKLGTSMKAEDKLANDLAEAKKKYASKTKALKEMNEGLDEQDAYIKKLVAKNRHLESERNSALAEVQAIIRRQQEDSFKNIESAIWTPKEDGQVKVELEELKRLMKTLTRSLAIPDLGALSCGEGPQHDVLMVALRKVLRPGESGILADGINKSKSPAIILNALLAHAVYTDVIGSAFFFAIEPLNGQNPLAKIYDMTMKANVEDANNWRANTLRLLFPQLNTNSTESSVHVRSLHDYLTNEAARGQAFLFLSGAASAFFNKQIDFGEVRAKVTDVFIKAAWIAIELWSRKIELKVTTFETMAHGKAKFDVDIPAMVPHALVDYEAHDDQLKGRPIRMFVHPLLEAFGTDEGDQYDKSRVLIPAEVWLPSGKNAEAGPDEGNLIDL